MKNTANENVESGEAMDNDLHQLFLEELADLYDAEQQLVKALPKMAKAAKSEELRAAFEAHLEETINHVARLEQLAEGLDEKLTRKPCKAMKGLIAEASDVMDEQEDSSALDAALILSAQKVEHYEIASYGGLCAWAKQMGHEEEAELLQATLDEEKAADEKLTAIAETSANTAGE